MDLRSAARFRRVAASAGSLVVWDSFKRASALRLRYSRFITIASPAVASRQLNAKVGIWFPADWATGKFKLGHNGLNTDTTYTCSLLKPADGPAGFACGRLRQRS